MADYLVKLYELPEQGPILENLKKEGITIRRALTPEKHLVLEWVKEHFSSHWASECEAGLARHPVSCIIATVAEKQEDGKEKSKMIGFACYDATMKGFFGPTGVDPEARGKGVGKALLLACMHALREEGYGYGIIGGAGPVEFYKKAVGAIEIPGSSPGIYKGMMR